ncbi:class F sortase [Streptomyces sp. TRM72054]|uniref:class F sortase n=1 Tax=Streptomyces sp. TRM72054 TaxID=2870562 RepID=UPI001C8C348E|nr:class F sortase [Streptomyces sp. TRM72054]MBX9395774.1 class F sortase [Streptomyces sp. TRM72054]
MSLNAAVVPVELGADGRLGVPEDGRSAGWWKDTAPPGSRRGTTVIAGHVDTRRGAAVFAPLIRARTGDLVEVTTAAATFDYRVRAVTVRRGDALPTELFRTGGPPRLVLITCTGPYQPGSGYRDRLYIDAAPVQTTPPRRDRTAQPPRRLDQSLSASMSSMMGRKPR